MREALRLSLHRSESTHAIDQIQEHLLRWLAAQEVLHGVLVDVYGVGV